MKRLLNSGTEVPRYRVRVSPAALNLPIFFLLLIDLSIKKTYNEINYMLNKEKKE